ncbi:MAG: hypothetical protein PHG66_01685 [Candidatus Colwellbacteria bacterium]|nr:hypothetical protein [Candidatus Colwellbacteria bacterium]
MSSELIFPCCCENCDEEIENPLLKNLCESCIPFIPSSQADRETGKMYRYKYEIRIWDGKIMKCIHNKRPNYCKQCEGKGASFCPHGKYKGKCKIDGCFCSQLCIHKAPKYYCIPCGGKGICEHKMQRPKCPVCSPENRCEHGNEKETCGKGDCHGNQRCKEHNIRKSQCVPCGGVSTCKHKRQKSTCIEDECYGSQMCLHEKRRTTCKECEGGSICDHRKYRSDCVDCGGSETCVHKKKKRSCSICFIKPENFCSLCKQIYVKGCPYYPTCHRCYYQLHPDEDMPTRFKSKQHFIHEFLLDNIEEKIYYDKTIEGGCSKKRPDWFIDMLTHSIIIECDENQHVNYSCDNKRTMGLFTDLGNRPLVMIRFNPDRYKMSDSSYSDQCFEFNEKNIISSTDEWVKRQEKLLQTIEYHIQNIPEKEITNESMFFDLM